MTTIAIILATILAFLFPAYLIHAIRCEEEKATSFKAKACLTFGALVFIVLALINS